MNDNQMINANVLQLINTPTENAPTISRFVEEYFSDLVPDSNYFAHLVRYDDTEVATTPTKPEELLARLPHEFPQADAVRVGGEFSVAVRTIERYLTIWQKTNVVESVSRGHYRRIDV